ncbi:hypothetical protein [Dactylosporangium sp. CS-033363]|uniref:hypothetical protein n=1 Tax=Dactylosporangium sp. CS-033363 TaxID=3239935 RepID=UPI003D924EE3
MIDNRLRDYARTVSSASRLQAEGVLAHAKRAQRRRAVLASTAAAAGVAVVAVAVALVVRPSGGPAVPAVVPASSAPVAAGCSVDRLPLPAGVTSASTVGADPSGRYVIGVRYPSDDSTPAVSILWTDNRPALLPADFRAVAVNASGLVVGEHGRLEDRRAAVIKDGAAIDLPLPAGGQFTDVTGVNARGEITGHTFLAGSAVRGTVWPSVGVQPRLLQAGGKDTYAVGVTDDGTSVGTIGEREKPYRWAADGTGKALPVPDGYRGGEARAVNGDWAIGTASTSRGGADGKDELTATEVPVRWNLRTGALAHGFQIAAEGVAADGTVLGRVGKDVPGVWRDGTVVTLPMPPGAERGAAMAAVGDGHTIIGWTTAAAGPTPLVWRGC